MPWSDHSDDDGSKPGSDKPGAGKPAAAKPAGAKPASAKPSPKPGAKPGPWGAPTPPAADSGADSPLQGARRPERESARKPAAPPPRKGPNPPTSDDLTILWRRLRLRVTAEIALLRSSGAPPRIAAVVAGAAVALWIASGSYVVPDGQKGIVTTFGAYSRTDDGGRQHFHLPAPIEQVTLVSTSALQVMAIGAAGADDPNSLMLTNDGNIVSVNFAVQYRIADPRKYLFDLKDPSDAIRAAAESAIRAAVGKVAYAQVASGARAAVQNETRAHMQATLDRFGAGVSVVGVQIVAAGPPKEVGGASQAAVAARQAVQAALTDANAAGAKAANDARAAAAKARTDAEAYSARVVSEAQADANRFAPLDAEYRIAPTVTKQRLYTETMERILSHARVVIDARGAAMPLILPQAPYRPHGPTVEAMTPGAAQ